MRKLALFLVLFAGGLAVLFLFNRRPEPAEEAPAQRRERELQPKQFTEIPLGKEDLDTPQGAVGILPDGPMEITQFAGEGSTRKRERTLRWDDVDPVGDNVYEVENLEVTLFDIESGEAAARLRSPRTRLRISFVNGRPTIGEGDKSVLTQVEVVLYRGAPVAPLTMRVPRLEWDLKSGVLTSEERVELVGTGFEAESIGMRADMAQSSIQLLHQGMIRLSTQAASDAILAADGTGPIVVKKHGTEAQSSIDITASEGARFAVTGEEPLQIKARDIHIVSRSGTDGRFALDSADAQGDVVSQSRGDTFRAQRADFAFESRGRLTRAVLDGDVLLQGGDNTFRSRHAEFEFGADGRLVRARLDGEPNGSVAIGRFTSEAQLEMRAATAEIAGVGPLVVDFDTRTTIDLTGPGDVRVPELDFALHAESVLRGSIDARDKTGELSARGAVRASYQRRELESDALTIAISTAPSGERLVDARTEGPTTVRGDAEGERFSLVANAGLEVRSQNQKPFVSVARDVVIVVEGARGFRARADVVRDVDIEAWTFFAEGRVSFENARSAVTAPRATVRGKDDVTLNGVPGEPARYRSLPEGADVAVLDAEVEALEIRVQRSADDVFDARGAAKGAVRTADREYRIEGDAMHFVRGPAATDTPGSPRPIRAEVQGNVRLQSTAAGDVVAISSDRLTLEGEALSGKTSNDVRPLSESTVRALGNVRIDYTSAGSIHAEGDALTMQGVRRGRLSADPGRRVRASGRITSTAEPYALTADWVDFDEGRVQASKVEVEHEAAAQQDEKQAAPALLHLRADDFVAGREEIRLTGNAHADGTSSQGEVWEIDAGSIRVRGDFRDTSSFRADRLSSVEAWGGFRIALGARLVAHGERLTGEQNQIRLEGQPAKLETASAVWESAWIEYDMLNMLLATDKGVVLPAPGAKGTPWSVTYESMQPFDRGDATILALRNPVFRQGVDELRSDWVLLWIDREEWRSSGQRALNDTSEGPDLRVTTPETPAPAQPAPRRGPDLLGKFRDSPLAKVLSEVYFEGSIELLRDNRRRARAAAIYLDLREQRGWVQDADVLVDVDIRGETRRLRAKAQWMRIGANGSLRADHAVITSCSDDEPHYVVETGDLRLTRNDAGALGWDVSARRNAMRFGGGFAIPLPPLVYQTDKKGNPLIESFILGNSSQFGAQARASFNFTLGKVGNGVGKFFGTILDLPETDLDGHWKFNAGYLGSRGLLLGVGLELEVPEQFKLDMAIDGIPDNHEDKGLVRVPVDERSTLRDWFRARGRYHPDKTDSAEWFDLAVSLQSDPGVQSEFFQRDYLEYEQKDNYVHWRKAREQYYYNASLKVVVDDRTDIEELPSTAAFRGRTPIGHLGTEPILYTARAEADYLNRLEGNPQYYAPYPDGLGERDVLRFDTEHRLEVPIPLGFANVRASPFVEARGSAWDKGVDPDTSPARAELFTGVELGTTFWRTFGNGSIHTIAPTIDARTDIATASSGGDPVEFDRIEFPTEGQILGVGFLSKWWKPKEPERFDLEVHASHASGVESGVPEGYLPVTVLSELLLTVAHVPVGLTHDGRYDTSDGETIYSRSYFGFEPTHKLGIELGYNRGINDDDELLYEAASLAGRYRATRKWELELEQTISLVDDQDLSNAFVVRRLGHDFVTEVEIGYVAGEGSSFSIKVIPMLSYKRSGLGLIDRWLGASR